MSAGFSEARTAPAKCFVLPAQLGRPALPYLLWRGLLLGEVGCSAAGSPAVPGAGAMRGGRGTSRGHAEPVAAQRGRRNSHTRLTYRGEKQSHTLGPYRG